MLLPSFSFLPMKKIGSWFIKNSLFIAWIQALVGMVVSLYFSEILHYAPCDLCWYQRILLYPLAIILAVGILKKDHHLYSYVMPFGVLGMIVAFYHYLLQMGVIPENLAPCVSGISCKTSYFTLFGFINIPLLSFVAFAVITVCVFLFHKFFSK